MSARRPYYVLFRRLGPLEVFETNAANDDEALDDFADDHVASDVEILRVTDEHPLGGSDGTD